MRATRVIAGAVVAASIGLSGWTALEAQTLRSDSTPAEFPPASYAGKQYVDSKGCVYIRAGIDGNVTWVPRVTRDRKIVCGFKPSLAGTTAVAAAPRPAAEPEVISIAPAPAPRSAPAAAAPRAPAPARAPVAAAPAPARAPATAAAAPVVVLPDIFGGTGRKPSPGPEPTVIGGPERAAPAPAPAAAPRTVRTTAAPTVRAPSPGPAPTVVSVPRTAPAAAPARAPASAAPRPMGNGKCPGASAFSQQFINDGSRFPVRCGPQAEAPMTIRGGRDNSFLSTEPSGDSYYVAQADTTRVVPRHVYDNRRNTQNFAVPEGYRAVWDDDRLNADRAERTLAPDAPRTGVALPSGYRMAWDDDRLNPARGARTAAGDAGSDQIWTRTVPRTLVPVPTDRQIVRVTRTQPAQVPRARTPGRAPAAVAQPAPRATPKAVQQGSRRYIRVATYETDAGARASAQSVARSTGLSIRLGSVKRKGKTYRMVLAGPYTTQRDADAAMAKVRRAGFPNAKLSK